VPKSTTLDDLEGPLRTLFQNTCVFRSPPRKSEQRPILPGFDLEMTRYFKRYIDISIYRVKSSLLWSIRKSQNFMAQQKGKTVTEDAEIVLVTPTVTYADNGDVLLSCCMETSMPDECSNCSWYLDNSLVVSDNRHSVFRPQTGNQQLLTILRGKVFCFILNHKKIELTKFSII